MKIVCNNGTEVELTEDEEKVLRALRRLEKLDFGRLLLFGASGTASLRVVDSELGLKGDNDSEIEYFNIPCDGGDGGDNFI